MMERDSITRSGARAPGVGGEFHRMAVQYIASTDPTLGGSTLKHERRRQTGRRAAYAGSRLKLKDVPGRSRLTFPALEPYWREPAVRNLRGDRGNVGIIRSPVRASILPDHFGCCGAARFVRAFAGAGEAW